MRDALPHIFELTPPELADVLAPLGMPGYRVKQVLHWVYRQHVADPMAMSNLSRRDRQLLVDNLQWLRSRVVRHQQATDGVQKLLMDWSPAGHTASHADETNIPQPGLSLPLLAGPDSGSIDTQTECVMIPVGAHDPAEPPDVDDTSTPGRSRARRTACISSQIGCPVGCHFCASGLSGLDGNLSAGQIVEQVWRLGSLPGVIDADDSPSARPITHVVFMGMGEPLANFPQVTRAIQLLMADWGLGLSGRRITVSTVGVPMQIRKLADLALPVTLAISLHAPNDEVRRRLIPWAQRVTVAQLLDAAAYYFQKTRREVTLEYILLRHVNDRPEHARELAAIARRLRCNVNLIRYNEVRGLPFDRPTTDDVHHFQSILRHQGVNTHIRASRGRDIAAACGQLRHEHAASA